MPGDIALIPDLYGNADCLFLPGDITTDSGLETAVILSLFTDARDPESGEGGYWGDAFEDQPLGSLLWLLRREKMGSDLLNRAQAYCKNALQWLIDQDIAASVEISVMKAGMYAISIEIDITKADASTINIKYSYSWAVTAA